MTGLLEYIKNIGFFLILVSVVCNALPENGFKKYCKLFCGLVLVVLVLTPINAILNFDGDIGEIFAAGSYEGQVKELKSKLLMQERLQMDNALEQYENGVCQLLEDIATTQGIHILDVDIEYSYEEQGDDIVLDSVCFVLEDKATTSPQFTGSQGGSGDTYIENINIDKIDKIDISDKERITDIEDLSYGDRPKVLEFVKEAASRLNIDDGIVKIVWRE